MREDIVLEHVIGAIEDAYLTPKTYRDLRQELYRQVDRQTNRVNCGKLKQRLTNVAPDEAKPSTMARLRPFDPPVTKATRPLSRNCSSPFVMSFRHVQMMSMPWKNCPY